jgi:phage terminase Nu1 subunit (DNA packaging protein)
MSRPHGFMSKDEYAKHKEISLKTLSEHIRMGNIVVREINGRIWIDPVVADRQYEKNVRKKVDGNSGDEYAKARSLRERANAEKAVLQVAEYKRTLIKRQDVERQGFLAGQKIKQALETIPSKLGARLAAITDPHRVEITLKEEIERILLDLCDLSGHVFDEMPLDIEQEETQSE